MNSIASTHVGVLITDVSRKIKWVNEAFLKEVGYSWDEVIDETPRLFQGKDTNPNTVRIISKGLAHLEHFSVEIINYRKNGEPFWVKLNISPLFENEEHIGYVGFQEIIDDLKKQQKANELLLQEIHHRVKNNLAIISGMMELELFNAKDMALYKPLSRTRNRIISIAKVHELMYQSEQFLSISFETYLQKLITGISFAITNKQKASFRIDCYEVEIGIDYAIPLGLLLNELITNSYKYALRDSQDTVIEIVITQEEHSISVKYVDNGPGMATPPEERVKGSLGFQIIFSLLEQLEAKYKFDTCNKFELSFVFEM